MLSSSHQWPPAVLNPPAGRRAAAAGLCSSVTMRDRSNNRKPIQRGRYLSIEAIQAVQSLKRGGNPRGPMIQRLLKADMLAVLRELICQREADLSLQVFEVVRKEHWYKPQLPIYAELLELLATEGLRGEVGKVCSYLMGEQLEPDTEGFNAVMEALLDSDFTNLAMDSFRLMKLWEVEPNEATYKLLITSLESKGLMELSQEIRLEAEDHLGPPLDFLVDME